MDNKERKIKGLCKQVQEKGNKKRSGRTEMGLGSTAHEMMGKRSCLGAKKTLFLGRVIRSHSSQVSHGTDGAAGGTEPCHYFSRGARTARSSWPRAGASGRFICSHPGEEVAVCYLKQNDGCEEQIATDACNKQASEVSIPNRISFQRRTSW